MLTGMDGSEIFLGRKGWWFAVGRNFLTGGDGKKIFS